MPVREPQALGLNAVNDQRTLLSEDAVKTAVKAHLEGLGYRVDVRWGHERGVDIDAVGPTGRLLIEAKGEVVSQPQQISYFLNALGELLQRMTDADAECGIALPDNKVFHGLVARLPALAKQRLGLRIFFVTRSVSGCKVTVMMP